MGKFEPNFEYLHNVIAPNKIPVKGNENNIKRVAFDLFKVDGDKEYLWQIQADDDGNEFLVRTYEFPNEEEIMIKSEWDVIEDNKKENLTIFYKDIPIYRIAALNFGVNDSGDINLLKDIIKEKLCNDKIFVKKLLNYIPENKKASLCKMFDKFASFCNEEKKSE